MGDTTCKLKLSYFTIKGMGEILRVAMHLGDVEFEDDRHSFEDFAKMKEDAGKFPFGQMPVLTIDGVPYTQTNSLLVFVGKLAGLYPVKSNLEALYVDEVVASVRDVSDKIFSSYYLEEKERKASREAFLKNDLDTFVGGLEKIVLSKATSETWLCGKSATIADVILYYLIGHVSNALVDFLPADMFEKFPRLMASYDEFLNLEKVRSWCDRDPWTE